MSGFRRVVLFVFSLAGIACLVALALPWFGLFDEEIAILSEYDAYLIGVEVCLAMTGLWLLFELGRSVFSRRRNVLNVMEIDGGKITVTRTALASQAAHIVEVAGFNRPKHVDVHAPAHGSVWVTIKVVPYGPVNVMEEAPILHKDLVDGLTALCGDRLGKVNVEFLEPHGGDTRSVDEDNQKASAYTDDESSESLEPPKSPESSEVAGSSESSYAGQTTQSDEETHENGETDRPSHDTTAHDVGIAIPLHDEREE